MSIFLEFPSVEDYPVYPSLPLNDENDGRLPANSFNWQLTLQFSAQKNTELLSSDKESSIQE